MDLTFHNFPASIQHDLLKKSLGLITTEAYAAIQDLIQKANAGSFPYKAYSNSVET